MPVVKTKIEYSDLGTCVIGKRAYVFLRQHPKLKLPAGGTWVFTSNVLGFLKAGSNGPTFETMDSVYAPVGTVSDADNHQALAELEKPRKTPARSRTWGFIDPVRA